MFKKLLPVMIIVLIAITLIISAAAILWNYLDKQSQAQDPANQAIQSVDKVAPKKKSAQEIHDLTANIDDMITNLANGQIIKISFAFELENDQAKEEFDLLNTQIKSAIIVTLVDMNPDDIQGSKGLDALSTILMNKVNNLLTKGKVIHVNVTNFVLT
ncbi:MAG TPA: flagellar basal body-associated FliL family protein [Bacilli bacterium]